MNKGLKNFVIAACICIGIGIVFLIGGVAFGGVDLAKGIVVKQFGHCSLPFELKINSDGETGIFVAENMDDWDEFVELEDFDDPETEQFAIEELRNLDVDFDAGLFIIEETDKKELEVQYEGEVEVDLQDDTLEINCDTRPFFFHHKNIVKILVPQDMKWERVDVDADAGKVDLRNMKTDEIDLDLSAGQLLIHQLDCDTATVNMDAGEIIMDQSNLNNLLANVDMGSFNFDGRIEKDCSVNVDAGNAIIDLDAKEEDFNYNIKVDLGSIKIGDHNFSGTSNSEKKDNGTASNMELNCNLGAIQIDFK